MRLLYVSWGVAIGAVLTTLCVDVIPRDACPPVCDAKCAERITSGCFVGAREICTSSGCIPVPLEVKEISIPGRLEVGRSSLVTVLDAMGKENTFTNAGDISCIMDYIQTREQNVN